MKIFQYGLVWLCLFSAETVFAHDATYYTHYTNSGCQLNLTISPNQAVYWSGAILDMQIRAFGYIQGYNSPGNSGSIPVNCYIDGQMVSTASAPWSPYGVYPVNSSVPVLGLSEGPHTIRIENTNTWEYSTETLFASSYSHREWFSTYYHYYYNVYHRLVVPCEASQPFTVLPSTNFHKIALGKRAAPATVLLDETFDGTSGSAPDPAQFTCVGEVAQDGSSHVSLQTWSCNDSSLRSTATATAGNGLRLKFRASTYAEGTVIYGDGQPRGLRAGTDPNNVVEFYSVSGTMLGMRTRWNGAQSSASYALSSGVDNFNDYEITLTPLSATFSVNGTIAALLTNNIPPSGLNFHMSTFDGYAGNVPATLDSVQLTASNLASTLCEITYTGIPTNTYWLYFSSDLVSWNLHSSSRSAADGLATWSDTAPAGQRFYRIVGP